MFVYNYDPVLKFYASTSEADESPLEPGVFLIPAHATTIEPPECTDEQIAVFYEDAQRWEVIDRVAEESFQEEVHPPKEPTEEQKEFIKNKVQEKIQLLMKAGLTKEEAESFMLT